MIQDLQKASVSKRLSAFLLDIIVFILIAAAIASLLSLVLGYGKTVKSFEEHYKKYEDKYAIDTNMTADDYAALTPEEKERYEAASKALAEDIEIVEIYTQLMNKTILIVFVSLFFTFVIAEMALPLFLKNGQTLGKKIFGIGVMRTDGVRVSNFQMFVRSIFGKFLMETMIPAFVIFLEMFGVMSGMGIIVTALILIFQVVLLIATKNNSAIHDTLAVTVVVDMQSQMIFDTVEDLIEYKKKLHEEEVQNAPY